MPPRHMPRHGAQNIVAYIEGQRLVRVRVFLFFTLAGTAILRLERRFVPATVWKENDDRVTASCCYSYR
jgi:hypothetical protein